MSIGQFCNKYVVTATRSTTVLEAAHLMRHNHVGDVVVVDEVEGGRVPVGIVTDRDIVVEIVCTGLDASVIQVGDLLSRPLVTVGQDDGYAETVRTMTAHGVRRMPVVDDAGRLVGIVTLDDLLHQLATPLAALSTLAQRERAMEMGARR
jgi:CBS domain-containing protein